MGRMRTSPQELKGDYNILSTVMAPDITMMLPHKVVSFASFLISMMYINKVFILDLNRVWLINNNEFLTINEKWMHQNNEHSIWWRTIFMLFWFVERRFIHALFINPLSRSQIDNYTRKRKDLFPYRFKIHIHLFQLLRS